MRKNLFYIAIAAFSAGCGGGGSSPDAQTTDTATVLDDGAQETAGAVLPYCTLKPALAGVADLSGTWVARFAEAQVTSAPFVGVMHTQYIAHVLLTIAQSGSDVVADGRYCDRALVNPSKTSNLATAVIPDAWAHTETPVHRTGSFTVGLDGASIFALAEYTEIIGAVLANPEDPLPTSIDDLRIIDQDGDGKPGITIVLTGIETGSLYSVQRQVTSANAIAVAADRVEGALAFTSEQNVLGSDPDNLAGIYAAGKTSTDPEPCNSTFVMVKIANAPAVEGSAVDGSAVDGGEPVDGGGFGCEWVRANESALFP